MRSIPIPVEVAERGTETYWGESELVHSSHLRRLQSIRSYPFPTELSSYSHKDSLTEGDAEIKDEASSEHLRTKSACDSGASKSPTTSFLRRFQHFRITYSGDWFDRHCVCFVDLAGRFSIVVPWSSGGRVVVAFTSENPR
jgi:hypothetical protein